MLRALTRPRRVVITGMGCVTPLGIGRESFWDGLLTGKSGVRKIQSFDASSSPVQIAAEVPGFDWQAEINPKDRKHVPRTVPLAFAAAREALEDAGIHPSDLSLKSEERLVLSWEPAAAASHSPNNNISTGILDQPTKRLYTRFPLPPTVVYRANCRWRSGCEDFPISSRPAVQARRMRLHMRHSTSHLAGKT